MSMKTPLHRNTHQFELLHVRGVAVVGLDQGFALVEDGADHHAQGEHVTQQAALWRRLHLRRWEHTETIMSQYKD